MSKIQKEVRCLWHILPAKIFSFKKHYIIFITFLFFWQTSQATDDAFKTAFYFKNQHFFVTIAKQANGDFFDVSLLQEGGSTTQTGVIQIEVTDLYQFLSIKLNIIQAGIFTPADANTITQISTSLQTQYINWKTSRNILNGLNNLNSKDAAGKVGIVSPWVKYYNIKKVKDNIKDVMVANPQIDNITHLQNSLKILNNLVPISKNSDIYNSAYANAQITALNNEISAIVANSPIPNTNDLVAANTNFLTVQTAYNATPPTSDRTHLNTALTSVSDQIINLQTLINSLINTLQGNYLDKIDSIKLEFRNSSLRSATVWIKGGTFHLENQSIPLKTRYDYQQINNGRNNPYHEYLYNDNHDTALKLTDILHFEPSPNAHDDNYGPQDTVVVFKKEIMDKNNYINFNRSSFNYYLRFSLYSDFLALFFDQPNSIVQSDALFYTYLNTKHGFSPDIWNCSAYSNVNNKEKIYPLNALYPMLTISKFDHANSKVNVLHSDNANTGNSVLSHVDALDVLHHAYLKAGLGINILSYYVREWSTYVYLDYKPQVLLTTMRDSLGVNNITTYDIRSWYNEWELVFKIRQNLKWGVNVGISAGLLNVQKPHNIIPTFSPNDTAYVQPGSDIGSKLIYSPEVEFFYSTNGSNSNRVYLKMKYTTINTNRDDFLEILVGYSADIRSIKIK